MSTTDFLSLILDSGIKVRILAAPEVDFADEKPVCRQSPSAHLSLAA